jgi:hypothetical protein
MRSLHPTSGPFCCRDLENLLHPSRIYERPADVLKDADLSLSERRAILSAWASDACAVTSSPTLRHAPFAKRPATFDEIMDALHELDRPGMPRSAVEGTPFRRRADSHGDRHG